MGSWTSRFSAGEARERRSPPRFVGRPLGDSKTIEIEPRPRTLSAALRRGPSKFGSASRCHPRSHCRPRDPQLSFDRWRPGEPREPHCPGFLHQKLTAIQLCLGLGGRYPISGVQQKLRPDQTIKAFRDTCVTLAAILIASPSQAIRAPASNFSELGWDHWSLSKWRTAYFAERP